MAFPLQRASFKFAVFGQLAGEGFLKIEIWKSSLFLHFGAFFHGYIDEKRLRLILDFARKNVDAYFQCFFLWLYRQKGAPKKSRPEGRVSPGKMGGCVCVFNGHTMEQ